MLCEKCGKKQATFFYKQTKNGYTTEKNLCSECAKNEGLGIQGSFSGFDGFSDDLFGGFLGSFLEPKPSYIAASEACPVCGLTPGELIHGGRVGCENCYSFFRKTIVPTIVKIHGNVAHCGKVPAQKETAEENLQMTGKAEQKPAETEQKPVETELEKLKRLLSEAIEKQEYEDAAKYRDMIREIEKTQEGGENK
jgi:protein arginine kinase activator